MTVAWTSPATVSTALGGTVEADDVYLAACCDAANAWAFRKRLEAGYHDDPLDGAAAPSPDVAMGATLYAVALWRERAATDGYPSFEDLATYAPTGGSSGQIRRLLGIGRPATDAGALDPATVAAYRARRVARWSR